MFNSWQDFVLSTCGTFFCAALIPAVRNRYARLPRKTSIPTALGVAVVAITYASLGLLYSAVVQAVCAGLWTYLAVCRPSGSVMPPRELMRTDVRHPSKGVLR